MKPHDLPLCSHSPAKDWGHGTMAVLRNPITEAVYGLAGFCRVCRRTVKHIMPPPRVAALQTRVAHEGVEDAGDGRPDGLQVVVSHDPNVGGSDA